LHSFVDSLEVLLCAFFEEVQVNGGNVARIGGLQFYGASLVARVHMYESAFVLGRAVCLVEVWWAVGEAVKDVSALR
jgi:hypothetical protein